MVELVPLPASGRRFVGTRRVRLGDASPAGRLRLDAVARYLQDVAADDAADAAVDGERSWVVRRTAVQVTRPCVLGERVTLTTWCGGTGSRWADRRTSLVGDRGGSIEASSIWVHIDPSSGRPTPLPAGFASCYGEAAGGRTVRARLWLPDPTPDPTPGPSARTWPLRWTDFDALGHVNNAVAWAAVEEALADRRDLRAPVVVEVEHKTSIEPGDRPVLVTDDEGGHLRRVWLRVEGVTAVAARVERIAG